mgnify:FL=1
METISSEIEILREIRDSEKEAEIIVGKAQLQKEKLIEKAKADSSILLAREKEALGKAQERKITALREKAASKKNEALEEGRKAAKQLRAKAEKNISKAVDFVTEKFEGMIDA